MSNRANSGGKDKKQAASNIKGSGNFSQPTTKLSQKSAASDKKSIISIKSVSTDKEEIKTRGNKRDEPASQQVLSKVQGTSLSQKGAAAKKDVKQTQSVEAKEQKTIDDGKSKLRSKVGDQKIVGTLSSQQTPKEVQKGSALRTPTLRSSKSDSQSRVTQKQGDNKQFSQEKSRLIAQSKSKEKTKKDKGTKEIEIEEVTNQQKKHIKTQNQPLAQKGKKLPKLVEEKEAYYSSSSSEEEEQEEEKKSDSKSNDESESASDENPDEEMEDESSLENEKPLNVTNKKLSFQRKQEFPSLYSRILKFDKLEKRFSLKFPRDLNADSAENKVCQVCYQATLYPGSFQEGSNSSHSKQEQTPNDSQMLYQIAYCKQCYLPAHWSCIGTDVQLVEYSKNQTAYYFYECDRCKYKTQSSQNQGQIKLYPGCMVCDKDKGLLKALEIVDDSKMMIDNEREVALRHIGFYHQICAMSFPDTFITVVNSDAVNFTLKENSLLTNSLILNKKEKKKGSQTCSLCKSSFGLMLQSESKNLEKPLYAHPFCINEQQYEDEFKGQENYTWSFQVINDRDNQYIPKIKVLSDERSLRYCMCKKDDSNLMIQCDTCKIWYHFTCVDEDQADFQKDDQGYQCKKCKAWKKHLEDNLLDIIYKRKTYQELLDDSQIYGDSFDSLCNYDEDSDMAIQVPIRYFEHFILIRAWHMLTEFLLSEVVEEDLIDYHIKEATYLFPFVDSSKLRSELNRKKQLIEDIIQEACAELTLKDLIPSEGNTPPASQVSRDQRAALISHNKQASLKAEEIEQKCLAEAKMVNESIMELRKLRKKCAVLQKAVELLEKKDKPKLSQIRELCEKIDELDLAQEGYKSIETVKEILSEYEKWVTTSLEELKKTTPEEEKVRERLNTIKLQKVGLKRQEARYRMFKEYLTNKSTIEQARDIIQKSSNLKVDASDESLNLEQLIDIIAKFKKNYDRFEQNPETFKNPPVKALEFLIEACCFPIKLPQIDRILEVWNQSIIWSIQAKRFLLNKLDEDQKEELKSLRMDIDEGNTEVTYQRGHQLQSEFVWTLERAKGLLQELDQAQANQQPLFVDQQLCKETREKVNLIENLKVSVKQALVEKHEIKLLKDCIKQMEEIETFDFRLEIHKLKEKIKLLVDVKNVIENESNIKQSVELLELIQGRVTNLGTTDNNEYPIQIPWDSKMMLNSKVTAAKEHKKEFNDLLEKYQNMFNKNMVRELKAIVARADEEYHIDMKKEQKIIENIPFSEEWFLQTYEKLKKVTGKALIQVDFKDFIELSTVLKDEKECITLLKSLTKTPDNLVGAAQNLWKALSGVKWLFEFKRLLKYQQGGQPQANDEIELKKVVELDLRAREFLGINYDHEIARNHTYSKMFADFKSIVECIRQFDEKFGNYQKLIRTLENNQDRLEDFKQECEHLTQVIHSHNITSQSGELDLLSKIHTYINFQQQYKELTAPLQNESQEESKEHKQIDTTIQEQDKKNKQLKIPYEKAMLLQQIAKDQQIPEDLTILKRLRESVATFEKFQREYKDYKRYRERALKRVSMSGFKAHDSMNVVETRFTCQFVRRLIEESKKLQIEQPKHQRAIKDEENEQEDYEEEKYFDSEMLEGDLRAHDEWRVQTEHILSQLEDDDVAVTEDSSLRNQYEALKDQMRSLPLYDQELFIRMQVFEWLYSSLDMLNGSQQFSEESELASPAKQNRLPIVAWETKIKQADTFLQQMQQQHKIQLQSMLSGTTTTGSSQTLSVSPLMKNLKSHSIYQRLIWEVEQARQVSDFVQTQRNNQKSLTAKYSMNDQLRQQQQYTLTNFFRNKHTRSKLEKMLDSARRSKIELTDEARSLDAWIKEHDKYATQYQEGVLFTSNTFEKLKEVAKILYLSPIDNSEIYFDLKPRLETAEAIKLDLKRIIQEHHESLQHAVGQEQKAFKRLKYSRIQHSLQIFQKECKIPGIKEIDNMLDRFQKCKEKLSWIQETIDEIQALVAKDTSEQKMQVQSEQDEEEKQQQSGSQKPLIEEIKSRIESARKLLQEVDIDMEKKELEIRRQLFELEMRHLFFCPNELVHTNHEKSQRVENAEAQPQIISSDLKPHAKFYRRIEIDEFKLFYEREFNEVKNFLQDDFIHGKFLELKHLVNDYLRKINRLEKKEDLQAIEKEVLKECPMVDFTQCLVDRDAQLILGKRSNAERKYSVSSSSNSQSQDKPKQAQSESSSSDDDQPSHILKRQKLETGAAKAVSKPSQGKPIPKKVQKAQKNDSSSEESEDDSGSSSNGSSGSDSGSESSSDESSSEDTKKKAKPTSNIAQNRARRNIMPKRDSDYIYDKKASALAKQQQEEQQKKTMKKKATSGHSSEDEEEKEESSSGEEGSSSEDSSSGSSSGSESDSSSSDSKESFSHRKSKGAADKKLHEKKRQLQRQLEEHRKEKKLQGALAHQHVSGSNAPSHSKPFGFDQQQQQSSYGGGGSLADQIASSSSLQNSLQAIKNKIRESSRAKIKEHFELKDTVFATLVQSEIRQLTLDIEEEIFKKHPEADVYYRKRIADICENLRFLKGYKDISELIAVKKALSIGKILQNHHAFKEDMEKLDRKIKERRQYLKELTKSKSLTQQSQPEAKPSKPDASMTPQLSAIEESKVFEQQEAATQIKQQPSDTDMVTAVPPGKSAESDDDLESYDSNPALFSDDEEEAKKNPMLKLQSFLNLNKTVSQQSATSKPQVQRTPYDPNKQYDPTKPMGTPPQGHMVMGIPSYVPVQYNPLEVFSLAGGTGYGRYAQNKRPSEPILYDPLRNASQSQNANKVRNVAPMGSLLRVWEGGLELAKDQILKCSMFSSMDIQTFQLLPDLPNTLQLKGKAKIQDVMPHFLRLKKDKRLLKGWITRKNIANQENNDRYTKLFDELDMSERSALFNVFQGVTLYLVPMNKATKDFCQQMGLDMESFKKNQNIYEDAGDTQSKNAQDARSLEEETHTYAFMSQIKQNFNQRASFLNPEILKLAKVVQDKPIVKTQLQGQFSPITSDEESEKKQPKDTSLQTIKTEVAPLPQHQIDQQQQWNQQKMPNQSSTQDPRLMMRQQQQQFAPQQQQPIIKQAEEEDVHMQQSRPFTQHQEEDDDEVDIDELIQGFKNNDYNIQTIQQKLMTIIHKVKGEKEVKLTQFLQELIKSLNNPQPQQQPLVKSESSMQQEVTNQGYSYPANLGMPPQAQQQFRQQQFMGAAGPMAGANQVRYGGLPMATSNIPPQGTQQQYLGFRGQSFPQSTTPSQPFIHQAQPQQFLNQGSGMGGASGIPMQMYQNQQQFQRPPFGNMLGATGSGMQFIRPSQNQQQPQTTDQLFQQQQQNQQQLFMGGIRPPPQGGQQQNAQQNMMGYPQHYPPSSQTQGGRQ